MYFHDKRQQFQFVQGSAWQDLTGESKEAQGELVDLQGNHSQSKKTYVPLY